LTEEIVATDIKEKEDIYSNIIDCLAAVFLTRASTRHQICSADAGAQNEGKSNWMSSNVKETLDYLVIVPVSKGVQILKGGL
jgi:hypothetical protein